jgi:hypothetical protein
MTTMMVGIQNSILLLDSSNGFKIHESLKGTSPQKIVIDSRNPDRAYCATFGDGLWKTDDGGQTWNNIGKEVISSPYVISVAVSSLNPNINKVYAGTEPTALYISNDGDRSWEKMGALNKLPSSKSWSFPPRPWTHHIRWIEPDANNPDYVFAAIEAGALVTETSKDHMILILWLHIQKHLSVSILLLVTDILKALITENHGPVQWKV